MSSRTHATSLSSCKQSDPFLSELRSPPRAPPPQNRTMAQEAEVMLERDHFNCSICQDTLRTPVTIPCGHNYCSACIHDYWGRGDFIMGVFVCPQCRQSFSPRPLLSKNTVLADVVERLKRAGMQEAPAGPGLAQADDVECDVCAGSKHKAVRSCLVCLASYCELHVKPHFESAAFKKHRLVAASRRLHETLCPRHDKLLEVYCRTDRRCVCYLCLTDEHKGHDTVLVEEEVQRKMRTLNDLKKSSQMRIQQIEKDAQELRQAMFSLIQSSRTVVKESDGIFTELIRSLELKRFEVRELINAQEKAAVGEAEHLMEKVQKEMDELKKNEAELDKLSRTEDPVQFLQNREALYDPPAPSTLPLVNNFQKLTFSPVMAAVTEFKGLLEEVCQGSLVSIYERVRDVAIVNPQTPDEQCDMTLCSDGEVAEQTAAVTPSLCTGLDQTPVNPVNPFLGAAAVTPTFSFLSCVRLQIVVRSQTETCTASATPEKEVTEATTNTTGSG